MRILLTGATGMVGRNLLNDVRSSEFEWLCPGRAEVDLTDCEATRAYFANAQPEFVIHAAGRVGGIQANIGAPVRFLVDNLDMGRNVLMSSKEVGVRALLNFGSTCMYPKDRGDALCEEDILSGRLEPTNEGYALAKITVARLALYISRECPELQYKTFIPCNLYGPYDDFDPQRSHMVAAIIHKLHGAKICNQASVEIWGSGEARREFLYVQDLIDAVFFAIADFGKVPSIVNMGLGVDYSVNDFYRIGADVVGYRGKFHHDIEKPSGMQKKLSCIRRAREWGWAPTHSLEEGFAKTYEFYLKSVARSD